MCNTWNYGQCLVVPDVSKTPSDSVPSHSVGPDMSLQSVLTGDWGKRGWLKETPSCRLAIVLLTVHTWNIQPVIHIMTD